MAAGMWKEDCRMLICNTQISHGHYLYPSLCLDAELRAKLWAACDETPKVMHSKASSADFEMQR